MKTTRNRIKVNAGLYLWMMVGIIMCPSLTLAQSCVEPPSGLVGWWPFDESQPADAFDISGENNHGKHVGGPTPIGIGRVDQALSFDGIDDYVEVPSSPSLNVGTGDFSIDAWVRISAHAPGRVTLVDKREDTPATRGYWFFLEDGRLGVQLADGLVTEDHTTTYPQANVPSDDTWHLVAVTVDRDDPDGIRFFLDDKQVGVTFDPGNSSGSLDNNAPLRVGSRSSSVSELFRGDMDEVEIFTRALQATETAAIYQAGSSGKCKEQYCCIIKDSDFHPADWMAIPLLVTNPMNAGYFETQSTFGGNPCDYLYMVHSLPPSKGPDFLDQTQVWVFYKYLRESVDPAKSMILSIDYREDQAVINTLPPDVNMLESRPALVQNGQIYIGRQGLNFTDTQWQSKAQKDLKETDFVEVGTFFALLNNGRALSDLPMSDDPYPDFSCSGSRIHFGFCRVSRRDDSNTVFTYQIEHGIDNWRVGVRCGACGCEPGAISGVKFEDIDGDGIKDPGEPGLPNWQIALLDEEGQIVADTATDMHGDYEFKGLLPGTYIVAEDQSQPEWEQTYPVKITGNKRHTVELSYGDIAYDMDFGNWRGNGGDCDETFVSRCEAGVADEFSPNIYDFWPTPSPKLQTLLRDKGCDNIPLFDKHSNLDNPGGCFGHTFPICWPQDCSLIDANMTIGLKAAEWAISSEDDRIEIYSGGSSMTNSPLTPVWSASIKSLTPNRTWVYPDILYYELDLDLEVPGILALLEQGEPLHVVVVDETIVDSVALEVRSCCSCPQGSICGTLYWDTNCNGEVDENDVPWGQGQVLLFDNPERIPPAKRITDVDQDGNYCFPRLDAPGRYWITPNRESFPYSSVREVHLPCSQNVNGVNFTSCSVGLSE